MIDVGIKLCTVVDCYMGHHSQKESYKNLLWFRSYKVCQIQIVYFQTSMLGCSCWKLWLQYLLDYEQYKTVVLHTFLAQHDKIFGHQIICHGS